MLLHAASDPEKRDFLMHPQHTVRPTRAQPGARESDDAERPGEPPQPARVMPVAGVMCGVRDPSAPRLRAGLGPVR
jgi:hypothetical protein